MAMRTFSALLLTLLVSTPALATEKDFEVKGGLMAMPLPDPIIGGGLEATYQPLRLTLAAEGARVTGPVKVWSSWLRWAPWSADGHTVGLLAGYNQSYALYPKPAMVPPPGSPDPNWEEPALLAGVYYEWSARSWWLRLSPHLAWSFSPYVSAGHTLRSAFVGPAFVEAGWQPVEHVEVGLRLSLAPLWIAYRF